MTDPRTDWMVATFRDRSTIVHERYYRHPIDRVWEAVANAELPGRPLFSLGGPVSETVDGTLVTSEPPNALEYTSSHQGSFRFELSEAQHQLPYGHVDDEQGVGTHLWLLHTVASGESTGRIDDDEGSDRPADLTATWPPDLVAGLHEFLDQLGLWLDGRWSAHDNVAYHQTSAGSDQRARWVDFYRTHLANNMPPV